MSKRKLTTYLATAIAEGFCEGEGASREEQIRAWQYLIDTGDVWKLQGFFGRTAADLIEQGICKHAKKQNYDYYGNTLPTRKKPDGTGRSQKK